jgi:adenosylcobinamide kinase/adenosylcobinamide-phosphate guanylyltransferase
LFTLVIGGSASGKSDYAERHVLSLKGDGPRIYMATMEPFGAEAQARIARHHAMRRDRGFETIECYRNAGAVRLPENSNVLLEDLGNLAANELFGAEPPQNQERAELTQADDGAELHTDELSAVLSERIAADIDSLRAQCSHLTIVTNEVFSGGKEYEGETLTYLRVLAALNRKLAARADFVVEVVCGLPDVLKFGQQTGKRRKNDFCDRPAVCGKTGIYHGSPRLG